MILHVEVAEECRRRPPQVVRFPDGTLERVHYEPENHILTYSDKFAIVVLSGFGKSRLLFTFAEEHGRNEADFQPAIWHLLPFRPEGPTHCRPTWRGPKVLAGLGCEDDPDIRGLEGHFKNR